MDNIFKYKIWILTMQVKNNQNIKLYLEKTVHFIINYFLFKYIQSILYLIVTLVNIDYCFYTYISK